MTMQSALTTQEPLGKKTISNKKNAQTRKIPSRQCVGCGEMKSKKEMIRVVKTAEQGILLDHTGKLNGRGAYLCASAECLKKARKSRGLERSFKMAIPKEVYDRLEKELEENG